MSLCSILGRLQGKKTHLWWPSVMDPELGCRESSDRLRLYRGRGARDGAALSCS